MALVGVDNDADPASYGKGKPRDQSAELAALVIRVGRGDDTAFAEFYDAVSPLVFGICRRVLRDVAESEEVAQEALLDMWRNAPRFDPSRGSVRAWCATIAHSKAVDRVRSAERRRAREQAVGGLDPNPGDIVSEEAMSRLDAQRVRRAVEGLSQRQRESVELAYFGGHTHTEIAGMLNLPLGTVKTRIRDGLGRLRHLIGDHADEYDDHPDPPTQLGRSGRHDIETEVSHETGRTRPARRLRR